MCVKAFVFDERTVIDMFICIYAAASKALSESYIKSVEELGCFLAQRNHGLVFGGGTNGLMGAAARGFTKGGAKDIICVAPKFFNVDGILYDGCTEYIYPDTMRERKGIMEDKSEAFIAVPGGIGTLDELFEIITLKSLSRHTKPIVLYNVNGFFRPMLEMLDAYQREGFLKNYRSLLFISDSPKEIADYLESYKSDTTKVSDFKNI